ncbi:MAG: asparagine synthase (glutamine-hydrolyzing) [Cohaesibacteraceae bacterium]|nr:asparagine synthase (glutamine-hydrolyzing) [Cohaesibacteraceae bacterium]
MCGIAGFLGKPAHRDYLVSLARNMGVAIAHRGPDGSDEWVDPEAGIAFAHLRLAIVDLSAAGAQPMVSSCGRYVIIYNGEIYNHLEMRPELIAQGASFRGHSDTEVILESIALRGLDETLKGINGMFALALWDSQLQRLSLVRDRIGIKPLYWCKTPDGLIFGSELKSLRQHPECPDQIDPNAVLDLMKYSYIPGHASIYKGVQKLLPGQLLHVDSKGGFELKTWWSLSEARKAGLDNQYDADDPAVVTGLHNLLADAVSRRTVSDVPFGAFLSGGIDSSTVVALMQAQSIEKIRTFSIGFEEAGYNEADHARLVAAHLGTNHTELYVTPQKARDVIPQLPQIYDEPFADSSQIPTFLVSQMTRRHVTVALSGDGGDEVFAGYNRYISAKRFQNSLLALPRLLARIGASALECLSQRKWDEISRMVPARGRPVQFGDKIHKLAGAMRAGREGYYDYLVSTWGEPAEILHPDLELTSSGLSSETHGDFIDRMQTQDMATYLPDDILTKVDRASMSVSLEARVPLLDHRIIEYAARLPRSLLMVGGQGKWALRQTLYRYVPRELVERPKMGFGVPIDSWLRGPLRDWAEDLLSPAMFETVGLLKSEPVRIVWQDHLSGKRNGQHKLWAVLMLHAWHQEHH